VGGTSKKVTVGYKYYLGVHFGLWKGPIDRITKISVDGREAWPNPNLAFEQQEFPEPQTTIVIDAPELFGGDAREGGVSGTVRIYTGEPDQEQLGYISDKISHDGSGDAPAFRGITTAVLQGCYMGNNPYLKPWSFRGERIHTRQDGILQWYDDKAEIPSVYEYYDGSEEQEISHCQSIEYDFYATINYNFAGDEAYNPDGLMGATYDDPNGPVVYTLVGVDPTDVYVVRKLPSTDAQTRCYVMGWQVGGGIPTGEPWATNRFVVTTPDNNNTLYWPETFDDTESAESYALSQADVVLTGYSSYKLWLWDDINVGGGGLNPRGGGRFYAEVLKPRPDQWSCFQAYSCNDMNPAHIIRECLTDPDWGMGYADSDIDDDAFMAAADTLWDELLGLSVTWSREGPLVDFINEILRHIDAVLYVDRTTGKFVLKLVRDDYSVSNLVALDESNVVSVSNANRPAIADLVSTVTVNHYDRSTGEQGSVTRHNLSLQQVQQGGGSATTISYPACTSGPLAQRLCQRDLVALSTPLLSCQIEVGRVAEQLNIGDAFILDWPDLGINSLVMRVQQLTLGSSSKQTIVIDALEDVFALPSAQASGGNGQGSIWTDPIGAGVLLATPRAVTEIPYYELVRFFGAGYMIDVLTADSDAGYLLASGGRQGAETNARLEVDAGAGYGDVNIMDFCPIAFAVSDIARTDTIIYITGQIDIDLVETDSIAQIGDELVRVDLVDQDSTGAYLITIGRGILDTVPAIHSAGDAIVFWGYDYTSDGVQYTASDALDVIMRTQLGSSVLTYGDAPVDVLAMDSRAIRPYPPGDLRVDGVSYPPLSSGGGVFYVREHTFTWKHRDRLQQTSDVPEDYTATDIGPEAGTTYRLDVYATLDDDSIVDMFTISGITSNSYILSLSASEPAPDNALSVHFTVTSVRDGYDSWQSPTCDLIAIFPGATRTLQDGTPRALEDGTQRKTES
jgi:hypothetical protein